MFLQGLFSELSRKDPLFLKKQKKQKKPKKSTYLHPQFKKKNAREAERKILLGTQTTHRDPEEQWNNIKTQMKSTREQLKGATSSSKSSS